MRNDKFFDEAGREAIAAAVRAAEATTSGEIVPVVVDASSDYHWISYRAAFLGWLAVTLMVLVLQWRHPFALELWEACALQLLGSLVAWGFSRTAWGFRLLVPSAVLEEEVLETARSAFVRHGLANTIDRTGVLLFVSIRERRVQVIADRGIHEKEGEEIWRKAADQIVTSIRKGKPSEGMVNAIYSVGERLALHFPARQGDSNELPDHLRRE